MSKRTVRPDVRKCEIIRPTPSASLPKGDHPGTVIAFKQSPSSNLADYLYPYEQEHEPMRLGRMQASATPIR